MVRAVGSEIIVNDATRFDQRAPALTATADGGFFAIWSSARSETVLSWETTLPVGDEVRGRLFTSTGEARTASLSLNSPQAGPDGDRNKWIYDLDVDVFADGSFALGWAVDYYLGDDKTQFVRKLSADLTPLSPALELGSSSQQWQGEVDVAALQAGEFLAIHRRDDSSRVFSVDDTTAAEVPSSASVGYVSEVATVALANGKAAIFYLTEPDDEFVTGSNVLKVQIYDPVAHERGAVTTFSIGVDGMGSLDAVRLANGNIALAVGGSLENVGLALILDSQAREVLSTTQFGDAVYSGFTTFTHAAGPQIAALTGGGFAITWSEIAHADSAGFGIKAQAFSAVGAALGAELLVNTTVRGNQSDPSITGLANGNFVVSWTDESRQGGDVSGSAVKARIFALDGIDRPVNAIESTGGDDTLRGHAGADNFFFDTAASKHLGRDAIQGFTQLDRIVTTSQLVDSNGDGIIKMNSSDRLFLPGNDENPESIGSLKVFYEDGAALSTLQFVGEQIHEGHSYFLYAAMGPLLGSTELVF